MRNSSHDFSHGYPCGGFYDGEVKNFLTHINLRGGIEKVSKKILHNLLYACFCEMFCSGISLINGSFYVLTMKDIKLIVGKKDLYKEPAEEIWNLLNAPN